MAFFDLISNFERVLDHVERERMGDPLREISNWIIEVNDRVDNMRDTSMELQQWRKRSIYRLPDSVIDLDRKACMPQVASFGPYHHGEPHLKPMEEHKMRALLHFLKRAEKPLELYVGPLLEELSDLKDAYDKLDPVWQPAVAFLKLMILDGCFILEILRGTTSLSKYAPNDPIFSNHGKLNVMPFIERDMLLLENQVPLRVLEILLAVENDKIESPHEVLRKLILNFFLLYQPQTSTERCLHILDVYRKGLIRDDNVPRRMKIKRRPDLSYEDDGGIIPSVTELYDAGVRFKRSKTSSMKDISFQGSTLKLPPIVVDDTTLSIFLNLIAFERLHVGAGNDVTAYAFFMGSILCSAKDVSLLRSQGIIRNALRSDEDVVTLFDLISKDSVIDSDSVFDDVFKMVSIKLRNRFIKRLNEWRSDLMQTYFKSPWTAVSVVAAIVLFTLTTIQTVYTVLSYTHPKT